jgi:hypothetical protein
MAESAAVWDHLACLLARTWDPGSPLLDDPIPWPEVAQLAHQQGVLHLIYPAARRVDQSPPDEVGNGLRLAYLGVAAANALRFRQMAAIRAALRSQDIPVVLLKGAALAESLYGNLALRNMDDLDLLVPHGRAEESRLLLRGLGYRPHEIEERPGTHLVYRGTEAFVPAGSYACPVGLHWHLLDTPYYLHRVPMGWFWERTCLATVGGEEVRVLSPEANLVYLPAHLALHHRMHGLAWLVDLAWLVHHSRQALDWEEIVGTAQRFELLLALQATLSRLASLWPRLPLAAALERAQALRPTAHERTAYRLLTTEPRSPFLDFFSDVWGMPDASTRLHFVAANTFPQAEYMERRYPVRSRWHLPYWYVRRLGDGAVKSLGTVVQMVRLRGRG